MQLVSLGNWLWPVSLCYCCEKYFNCTFKACPGWLKSKTLKLGKLGKSVRRSSVCVSSYFCDALTMAVTSVRSKAINQGTVQGGVWMKQHEVAQWFVYWFNWQWSV